jgi:arginyl-tRNA synthetase
MKHLEEIVKKSIKKIFKIEPSEEISLEEVTDKNLGDLTFPCFNQAKILKKTAQEIAQILAKEIKPDKYIEKAEAKRGYLNFFLRKEKIFKQVCQEKYDFKVSKKEKIVLEFSSPNTNKPLHLGHLRNTILGESIANLLKKIGHRVIKINLINDRGIHICQAMLMYQKSRIRNQKLKKIKGDHLVGRYYTLFTKEVQKDPHLLKEAQELLQKWEKKDQKTMVLWKKLTNQVLEGFKETYQRLGISFDKWYFESKIYRKGQKLILDALKRGICYKRKDGAVEIDLGRDLGRKVLLRPDGTSVYITQDIALAKIKFNQYRPSRSIYLTGHEQEYHFRVLFEILKRFGFAWAKKCEHFWHGMVLLPEGKMKSREGRMVEADELMDKMLSKVKNQKSKIKKSSKSKGCEKIAQAALKFYLLKFSPRQEIKFSPEESLALEGATGVYVMYAYVRICSILDKFKKMKYDTKYKNLKTDFLCLDKPEEWGIGKLLLLYPRFIQKAALNYNPAYLAEYLLRLASTFNKFYEKYSILSAETPQLTKARSELVDAVGRVLREGMELLGIEVVEEM